MRQSVSGQRGWDCAGDGCYGDSVLFMPVSDCVVVVVGVVPMVTELMLVFLVVCCHLTCVSRLNT